MAFRSASSNATASTSLSVAVPSGTAAGDVVVLFAVADTATNPFTTPTGFSVLPAGVRTTTFDSSSFGAWVKKATGSEGSNYTVSSSTACIGGCLAFSGRDADAFLADLATYTASNATDGSQASPLAIVGNSAAITAPSGADICWLGNCDVNASTDVAFAAPSGYTEQIDIQSGFDNCAAATKDNDAGGSTGTVSGTATYTGSAAQSGFLLVMPASAGGGGSSPLVVPVPAAQRNRRASGWFR